MNLNSFPLHPYQLVSVEGNSYLYRCQQCGDTLRVTVSIWNGTSTEPMFQPSLPREPIPDVFVHAFAGDPAW